MSAATCEWCGGPRPLSKGNRPRKYCSPQCKKQAWLARPGNRERDRADGRAWKAANPDRVRAYSATYGASGTCSRCDGPMNRAQDGGVCQPCRSADAEERARLIVAMWARGALMRDIAEELGTTVNALGVTMAHLRAKGYDLPYRQRRPDLASPAERHRTQADGPPPSRGGGPPSPAGATAQPLTHNGGSTDG